MRFSVVKAARGYFEALVHPTARVEPERASRHRLFIASRLTIGLIALGATPVVLATRGVPTALEALVLGAMLSPLAGAWYLAHTGAYARAHLLSAGMLAGFIALISSMTGGIASFAAVWLVVVPIEAMQARSRPVTVAATLLAAAIAVGLWLGVEVGWLASATSSHSPLPFLCSILSAAAYAAVVSVATMPADKAVGHSRARRGADEEPDDEKSRFLATVSHELRTPLNAIIGFSEMLTRDEEMRLDPARQRDYARMILDSGEHLLGVVNSMLDASRIESGRFEIAPRTLALRPLIDTCCAMMVLKAEQAGIRLRWDIATDLPPIHGDARALRQVLINLLANAIKFSDRGGAITVTAETAGDTALITVADSGIGIAESDLKRIGHPFFQASGSYERRYQGTGLGLSVVRGLIDLHHGRLRIESRLGAGTRVQVSLPLDRSAATETATDVAQLPTHADLHEVAQGA